MPFEFVSKIPVNQPSPYRLTQNAINLSEKLRMSEINLFFDTIVYLYRCITEIFSCNYHELSF